MERMEFEKKFVAARRAAICSDFTYLNDMQLEATMTTQGPLLLLAGAGSGKTTVLINRIANLLKYGSGSDSEYVPSGIGEEDIAFLESYVNALSNAAGAPGIRNSGSGILNSDIDGLTERMLDLCAIDPVEPWRIIAITFTNKAAHEMKERLERMLGRAADDIWAMTFHSACSRILRRDIDKIGYDRAFTIYDSADSASLMKRIMKDLDIEERNLPHKTILNNISRAKDNMKFAEDYTAEAHKIGDMRRILIGKAYLEYETRLKASNALDFDDLILQTVRLFMENPDVLQHYQNRFKYILIDEYQDTNNLQYLLAYALANGHGNICVVGDDDQSIYKFRGATIENIMNFEKHFSDARVIRLEQNYRSTEFIINAANDVIRNNKGRKGKKLWTKKDPGDRPELYVTDDERTEAQFVVDRIAASAMEGRKWSEHAVLYRMNAQSNQLETAFKRSGIPYRIIGGTGFYERAEIKDMLAYLCIIHNPQDDVRLLRIINNPPRGIGDTTIGRLAELAAELGIPVFDAIRISQNYAVLKSAAARLHLFADMVDDMREAAKTVRLDELYDMLIRRTGYIRMLEERDTIENISRIENVRELKSNIISFLKENENGGTLFDFLSETALYTDLDRDNSSTDRVNMMTMHSAKGLEFDTVFIVGAEEGVFPGSRVIGNSAEIEEERRLCYVAMTRAMRKLYFISARQRMLFGKTSSAQTSRFVREIDRENIEIHDTDNRYNYEDSSYSHSEFRFQNSELNSALPPHFVPNSESRIPHTSSPSYRPDLRITNSSPPSSPYSLRITNSGSSAALPDYRKGDVIRHSVFGRGVIASTSPAGGDALLEIVFDDVGTKRMMLKTAARYLSSNK